MTFYLLPYNLKIASTIGAEGLSGIRFIRNEFVRTLLYVSVISFFLFPAISNADSRNEQILVWEHNWDYYRDCLQLILDKTVDEYVPYTLVKSIEMEQQRAILSLARNKLTNVLILPTNIERERILESLNVYVNGHHMGYRVLLIPKGRQSQFDTITFTSPTGRRYVS